MFVCGPCHREDKTCPEGQKVIEDLMGPMVGSRGRCERCGQVRDCVDCHGYGTLTDNPNQRKETEMATATATVEVHEHEFHGDQEHLVCECGVTLTEYVRGIA